MKITHDKIADAAYINLRNAKVQHSIEVNERLIVDVDKDQNMVGVEVLGFSLEAKKK